MTTSSFRCLTYVVATSMCMAGIVPLTSAAANDTVLAQAPVTPVTQEPLNTHDRLPREVPVTWTPQVLDGKVSDIVQVGSSMVVGGRFTQISARKGEPIDQGNVFAFDATTGKINTAFAPKVSSEVRAVHPGPTDSTVYVAGGFRDLDGTGGKVFLLNVSDGSIVQSFDSPPINGAVNDLDVVDGELYVAGYFTKVGGQSHRGLVSLDARTGRKTKTLSVDLTENHNFGQVEGATRGAVGAKAISINDAKTTLAVVGNFRKADGQARDQMAVIDISGETDVVRSDWRTQRYEDPCIAQAWDAYIRDVSFAPNSSMVNVVSSGGRVDRALCDKAARFDTAISGDDIQPDWISDTGGDTLLSVVDSGTAVYLGGHQRWMNNVQGRNRPEAGAVPRAGLAGVDPANGVPFSWNPGRNPRGVGADALTVTDAGLWVGSDTEFIGNFQYRRPRLAFFPIGNGTRVGPGDTGSLPANVYRGGDGSGQIEVLQRINAGGPSVRAADGGPNWSADDSSSNPLRTGATRSYLTPAGVGAVGSEVPASTPDDIFSSTRWDSGSRGDNNELQWNIPVARRGEHLTARLYFANRCLCSDENGDRLFDVAVEGELALRDYDITSDVGHDTATIKEIDFVSDGTLDLDFLHLEDGNPQINGIEIVAQADGTRPELDGLARTWVDGDRQSSRVGAQDLPTGDLDWSRIRGATMIDGQLFYVQGNSFYRRSFDGRAYGTASEIEPYYDEYWSPIPTGRARSNIDYRGNQPSFYAQIPSMTGLAFHDGELFYTLAGSSRLYARDFVPESGIVAEAAREVPGFSSRSVTAFFFDPGGDALYFTRGSSGSLTRWGYDGDGMSGRARVVGGPNYDGQAWSARALFIGPGAQDKTPLELGAEAAQDDETPQAKTMGENIAPKTGETATDDEAEAPQDAEAPEDDNGDVQGADGTPPVLVGSESVSTSGADSTLTLPDAIEAGDTLVLFVSTNKDGQAGSPDGVGPWESQARQTNGPLAVEILSQVADGTESGREVSVEVPDSYKVSMTVAVYRGVDMNQSGVESVQMAAANNTDEHLTPEIEVAGPGRTVLSFWADRSSATTQWSAPSTGEQLAVQVGTGSARVGTLLVADEPEPGVFPSITATTDGVSPRDLTASVVLAPSEGVVK